MIHYGQIKTVRIFHRPSHHARVRHRPSVIRDCHDARVLHFAHLGQFFAARAFRQRPNWKHVGQLRPLPCSIIKRVTAGLSFIGSVFGIAQTLVQPPATAAAAPVAIVSLYSWPGSRRCTCRSIKPGATIRPVASNALPHRRALARLVQARRQRARLRLGDSATGVRCPATGRLHSHLRSAVSFRSYCPAFRTVAFFSVAILFRSSRLPPRASK